MAMYIKDGKNLFTVTTPISSNIPYNAKTGEITIPVGSHWFENIVYTFSEPIPANTKLSITAFVEKGAVSQGTLECSCVHKYDAGRTHQCRLQICNSTRPLNGAQVSSITEITTDTVTNILFHFYKILVTEEIVMKIVVKIGEAATEYEPFNHARRVKVLDKYGVRNEYNYANHLTREGVIYTERDITHVNRYTREWFLSLRKMCPFIKAGEPYTFACTVETDVTLSGWQGRVGSMDGTITLIPSTTIGYVKRVLTFTEEDLSKVIWGFGNNSGTVTWKNFMCVKGDYSNKEMPEWRAFSSRILNPIIFAKT